MPATDPEFACSIVINIPLPTPRLATAAMQAIQVDAELSPFVQRSMTVLPESHTLAAQEEGTTIREGITILQTEYKATTNRMLRVAVNGFMETLRVVLGIMEELDIDVLEDSG